MSDAVHPIYCGPEHIFHPINVLNLIFCVIWLIVLSIMGYYGLKNIRKNETINKSVIPTKFKYIFGITFMSGIISTI